MSKKRHRNRPQEENTNNMNQNNMNQNNNNPFGINPAQLMSMLGGNFDISGLNNMLASMNMDGFDLGNLNLGNLPNMFSGMPGMQGGNSQMGNINFGNTSNFSDSTPGVDLGGFSGNDENIQMLIAIRSIVDQRRASFIDKVIEKYNEGIFND